MELRNKLSLIDFHVVLSKILFMNEMKLIDNIIMIIESLAWLIELLNASTILVLAFCQVWK